MIYHILILCTGNSCRSQMAEAYLKSLDDRLEVSSGGTNPEKNINPLAVRVMQEIGLDISKNTPSHVDEFVDQPFDFVITVCDNARESCPYFRGKVKRRLHIGFEDPADAIGSEEERLIVYRRVRDEIRRDFKRFYHHYIKYNEPR